MSRAIVILSDDEFRRLNTLEDDDRCFGTLRTRRGHLPLTALKVEAEVTGLLARTMVHQTFVNTLGEPLEATYVFPLPDRAAVSRFRLMVGGRVVEGELQERGAARETYERAIRTGHRAAIAEEERPGTFTMRVGNLMPGEVARVELTLDGPLPFSDGEATFRFPLVVAPRYIPGVPLGGDDVGTGTTRDTDAVPDASRITPPVLLAGYPNPVHLDLSVNIDPLGLTLGEIRSSLHALVDEGEKARGRRVRVMPGERLDRDFVLRFSLGGADTQSVLALCPDDSRSDEGTFFLNIVPPLDAGRAIMPRDVVFVLDRSGSMEGWKMVAARRAVARMIDSLRAQDRFQVLAFDNDIDMPTLAERGQLIPATDRNRFRAVEFTSRVDARGGTEMLEPLVAGARLLAGGYQERERVLVLITDGQVGNESQILRELEPELRGVRVFTVGIDEAVNAGFLTRLASSTGGHCELVESEDRLDAVLASLHRRIDAPLFAELSLASEGFVIDPKSIAPARLPDLFPGIPVQISGRYRGRPGGAVTVRGRGHRISTAITVRGVPVTNRAVEKVWARARLRDLEDAFDRGNRNLARDLVEVSLRHGVLCRFTSFVAVDREEVVNPGGYNHQVTQAVESPKGWAGSAPSTVSSTLGGIASATSGGPGGAGGHAQKKRSAAPMAAKAMFEAPPEEVMARFEDLDDDVDYELASPLSDEGGAFEDEITGGAIDALSFGAPAEAAASAPMPVAAPPPPSAPKPAPAMKVTELAESREKKEAKADASDDGAPAQGSPRRQRSVKDLGRSLFGGRGGGATVVRAELARRAELMFELLDRNENLSPGERLRMLNNLVPGLKGLRDEVTLGERNLAPIHAMLEAVAAVLDLVTEAHPSEARILEVWEQVADALSAIVGRPRAKASTPTGRHDGFWR